ncbi:hypothetical protein [Robiginitomaculum antarcticum]|uniref:hypothetical protein n=1 Tax=Robiginitomaculum antarcticum TaxID=437507 RepID=UPI00036F4C6A|nr:hypothetical protein [Robiginitomaculum antarcticum]
MKKILMSAAAAFAFSAALTDCAPVDETQRKVTQEQRAAGAYSENNLNEIAREYVNLGLIFGNFDKHYVDAFTGDPAMREAARNSAMTLGEIRQSADALLDRVDKIADIGPQGVDPMTKARFALLRGDVLAMHTRARILQGETLTFDEETRLIYDAVAPHYSEADFAAARAQYDAAQTNKDDSDTAPTNVIPGDKVRDVMTAAIAQCRARTAAHYDLPDGENFDLAFVKDKPWSAYNWYKGDYRSLIEVNQDVPLTIDRALDLGCHEGYPGHHVFNILSEDIRINKLGWPEAQIIALYSPSAPLMEGSANYGLELAFPGIEKARYDADVLYPLAGLAAPTNVVEPDPELARARNVLSNVSIHVAREYLDGRFTREEAIAFYMTYGDRNRARAEQGLSFIETYRGYIINYTLGQDVVRDWVQMRVDGGQDRWEAFRHILDIPVTVGQLQAELADK